MHELALCESISVAVAEHARDRAVRRVTLRIGHLRQVVPDTLQFCWDLHVQGSTLEGCELAVEYVEAVVDCRECGQSTVLADPLLLCAHCNGANVELVRGEEFMIEAIDVAQEAR